MNDVLLAKLITDNVDGKWAHIHTTHNLFVVFALHDETESKSALSHEGKKLLERIQREYYALDDRNLVDIKEIVQKCFNELPPHIRYSGVVTALSNNTIYIITAGIAYAVMRRGEKQGVVAAGVPGDIVGFSGKLEVNDILILETDFFAQHISQSRLKELLADTEFSQIHDILHPHIHTSPKGGEAAIILHYTASQLPTIPTTPRIREAMAEEPQDTINEGEVADEEKDASQIESVEEKETDEVVTTHNTLESEEGDTQSEQKKSFSWKKFLPLGVILLIIILGITFFGLIRGEQQKREQAQSQTVYEQIMSDAQGKYDEALALLTVNGALGREKLETLAQNLEKDKNKLKSDSEEYKKLEDFIKKVNSHLSGTNAGTALPAETIVFDKKDFDDITSIGAISAKGGRLLVLDNPTGAVLAEGKVYKSNVKDASFVSFNSDRIFIANTDTISYIPSNTGKVVEQAESSDSIVSMDSFLGNVYVATDDNAINKYEADADEPTNYFTEDVSLDGITSLSIDGSIWVTTKDGKVHKFTRGKADAFNLSNSPKMGTNLTIYTDEDYSNIYLLDRANQTVHVFKKSGEYVNSFVSKISSIKSFAVTESSGTKPTLYIATADKVFSFELPL